MSDLATRIVDAIFDQWQADCGLTKAKAIERVQQVVSGYTVNKLPDGHAYIPIERYLGSQHFTVDDPPLIDGNDLRDEPSSGIQSGMTIHEFMKINVNWPPADDTNQF